MTGSSVTKPAVAQYGDPVGEPYGLVHVVGDEEDGGPVLPAQLTHQVLHLQPGQGVECGERLVEQQQFGFADQGAGEGDALRLAAGEGGGPGVGVPFETDLGQGPQPVPGAAARQGHRHIGEDLLRRYEAGFLEDDGTGLGDEDLSAVGSVECAQDAQQGRLAAAARAEQGDELAPCDVEPEAVEHGTVAEDAPQFPHAYGGPGCGVGHRVAPCVVRQGISTRSSSRTTMSAVSPSSP